MLFEESEIAVMMSYPVISLPEPVVFKLSGPWAPVMASEKPSLALANLLLIVIRVASYAMAFNPLLKARRQIVLR